MLSWALKRPHTTFNSTHTPLFISLQIFSPSPPPHLTPLLIPFQLICDHSHFILIIILLYTFPNTLKRYLYSFYTHSYLLYPYTRVLSFTNYNPLVYSPLQSFLHIYIIIIHKLENIIFNKLFILYIILYKILYIHFFLIYFLNSQNYIKINIKFIH